MTTTAAGVAASESTRLLDFSRLSHEPIG